VTERLIEAPTLPFEGTDETLTLPGVLHNVRLHRESGHVTLEAWSPMCGPERPALCALSPADRRAFAAFLMKDLL
jgi:hypothetical protein